MAKIDPSKPTPLAPWRAFAAQHRGNPFLRHNPLYALSEVLLDTIVAEAPTFFSAEQVAFERDLARTASFGFFHHRALGFSAGDRQADPGTGLSLQERNERSRQAIAELMAEELRRDGLSPGEIDNYFQQEGHQRTAVDTRKDAYAGWLISTRQFQDEVKELRASWEPLVRRRRCFPVYPRWPLFDDGCERAPETFRSDFLAFYRRWGLDGLHTWDWPEPMEPDLMTGMLRDLHQLADAGVVLFVPWYLLRGEKLPVQAIVQRARTACEAEHLWEWLQKPAPRKSEEKGDIHYERLLHVYRYHELVLVRRYRARFHGHVQQLDRALAHVMGRDEDTVKKLRLELNRVFRGAGSAGLG